MDNEYGYYVYEAAEKLNVTEQCITRMIRMKKLHANKIGKRYFIPSSEITRLLTADHGDSKALKNQDYYLARIDALERKLKNYEKMFGIINGVIQTMQSDNEQAPR